MKNIKTLGNLKSRKVLVRTDFNVPIGDDGIVDSTEDYRIERSLETLNYLKEQGAKTIIISHIGRDPKDSLEPVAKKLNEFLSVTFLKDIDYNVILGVIENMKDGDIILLENLRKDPREEANDPNFAEGLASLGDVYVNEAFSVSHRNHASVVGIPNYLPSYAGIWLQKEIENLTKLIEKPEKPFLFIVGGSKFETKLPLIERFAKKADTLYVGGALANNFLKVMGLEVGKSVVDDKTDIKHLLNTESIKVPYDVLVDSGEVRMVSDVKENEIISDLGPESLKTLEEIIKESKTVLWNGPLGWYEKGFKKSTEKLLKVLAESDAYSVVGGGDTIKLIENIGVEDKLSFVSTGGGAMLEFLLKGTLPGIEVLNQEQVEIKSTMPDHINFDLNI